MKQTVTAKLQILVNPSDKQILCDTMKAYSDACNYVSEYIYKTHNLSRYSVQEDTYYQVREVMDSVRKWQYLVCVQSLLNTKPFLKIRKSGLSQCLDFLN